MAKKIRQKTEEGEKDTKKKLNFMRVDNNQHAITALIEAYELGLLRE